MIPGPNESTTGHSGAEHHGHPVENFPDYNRTARTHVGESIADTRNWPGIVLVALGLVGLGLTLTAAGYGFEGWAVIGAIATVLCFAAGILLVVAEHRRLKAKEGRQLSDQAGH
ncbi:hypothetical protein F5X71_20895 [Nocardia brasiliensis]|uniref:UsfY protein n=1 Tax=Nocardia brasiliensis TaxID=37326 RepID=A0A6G9XU72_NOCBR|nr:hypothetical protein [Nocardia brasiliensis]QIS04457.1 hypothetical protein F5X71_20895 [Nocardia brasiliensis]